MQHKGISILISIVLLVMSAATVLSQQAQTKKGGSPVSQSSATPTPAVENTTNNPAPTVDPNTAPNLAPQKDAADDHLSFMKDSEQNFQQQAPSTGGLMLRTLGALLLIVGLIVAASWGMKRFGGARFGKASDDAPELSILNSVALGDKRSLAIVRFGDRTLLIGSTAQSVTLLGETSLETPINVGRSVAEILGETESNSFADELSLASLDLDDSIQGGKLTQW